MSILFSRKRFLENKDVNSIVPSVLDFSNVQTDENGYLEVDLGIRRLILSRSTEMCLSELHTSMSNIINIQANTRHVTTIKYTDSPTPSVGSDGSRIITPGRHSGSRPGGSRPGFQERPDTIFTPNYEVQADYEAADAPARSTTTQFPNCKVATLEELCNILTYILDQLHITFTVEDHQCSMVFLADSDEESIEFDVRIARVLGLCRVDGSDPVVTSTMFGNVLQWSRSGSGNDMRIKITRTTSKGYLKIILPHSKTFPAWNFISSLSSQALFVSSDLVEPSFTGTKITQTLAIAPIDPVKDKLHYEPYSADWKKVNTANGNNFRLFFQDSTGKPFANLPLTFVLQFRNRRLI